jgi:hypothetical protein
MNFYLDANNSERDRENPRKAEKQRLVHVKTRKQRQTPRILKAITLILTSNR